MPSKSWRIAGILLVILYLLALYYIFNILESSRSQTATERFDATIQYDTTRLKSRFEVYADTLYSGRGLFLVDNTVSRQGWTAFVDAQNISQRYPGVSSISYVTVINKNQSGQLTAQLNADRLPNENTPISIYPESSDSQLAVTTYLGPLELKQSAIGYDMYSSPVRKQALDAAQNSGLPQASSPLIPASNRQTPSSSLIIVLPVYHRSSAVSTVAERQAAIKGFVVMSLTSKPLLDAIFNQPSTYGRLPVTISTHGQQIYKLSDGKGSALHKTIAVNVAGQTWNLSFNAPANFSLSKTADIGPTLFLIGGLLLAVILTIALYYAIDLRYLKSHTSAREQIELKQDQQNDNRQ